MPTAKAEGVRYNFSRNEIPRKIVSGTLRNRVPSEIGYPQKKEVLVLFLEFFNLIASKHKGEICLIRNGIFFLGINEQAIFLEKCLSLKKGCFGKFVCKVGFLLVVLEKILKLWRN